MAFMAPMISKTFMAFMACVIMAPVFVVFVVARRRLAAAAARLTEAF